MTVREALNEAAARIARRDAEILLLQALRQQAVDARRASVDPATSEAVQPDRAWLLAHGEDPLPEAVLTGLRDLSARRATHEPLQHITGEQEFFALPLRVTRDTLIPRPETEHLVEAVLLWAMQFHDGRVLRIADVGTGTGAIAIALATHLAGAEFVAIDNSSAALEVAAQNARSHGCSDRIQFVPSDLMDVFLSAGQHSGGFDAVVSNPPYVALADAASMQPEVVGFEPHGALFAGEDGLDVYRRLIPQAHAALRRSGLLALEFGFGQRAALHDLLAVPSGAWRNIRFADDYAGIPRVALAEKM
jgi:release factor glutamine methyltransferase